MFSKSASLIKLIIAGAIVAASLIFVFLLSVHRDPEKFFEKRRSAKLEVLQDSLQSYEDFNLHALRLQGQGSPSGGSVEFDAFILQPSGSGRLLPAFILIGGLRTGRDAIGLIASRPEIARQGAFFTLDYPYSGPLAFKGLEILPYLPQIRKALFDGVEAVSLAIDYLEQQPGIDSRRIVLLGVSLGAFYAINAGAVDARPAAVMSFMGGGQIGELLAFQLRRGDYIKPDFLVKPVAFLAEQLIWQMEPINLVAKISPRPYFQINARADEMIPEANAITLFEAAKKPRKMIWMPTSHIRPNLVEIVDLMIGIAQTELFACGILP